MDFIAIMGIYLAVCCIFMGCYLTDWVMCNYPPFSYIVKFLLKGIKVVEAILPSLVKGFAIRIYYGMFLHRNILFQLVYILIVVVCHGIGIVDALPYMYSIESDINHTYWLVICFVFNLCCFLVCSFSDPGIITPHNIITYKKKYRYDGIMYESGRKCPSCNLEKVARSKHCGITDRCVYKFDHFCLFTNSCVGGLNHRYFILFLISICSMTANGIILGVKSLQNIIDLKQLWKARYVDQSGEPQKMNLKVLLQTLFMQHPRIVFVTVVLPFILAALVLFTMYHLYLVLTNQTTNERYKLARIQKLDIQHAEYYNPFNKGLMSNVLEFIFPLKEFNSIQGDFRNEFPKYKNNKRKKNR